MNEAEIYRNRENNVREMVDRLCGGNISEFAREWTRRLHALDELEEGKEMQNSIIHRWFADSEHKSNISDRHARKLENAFDLMHGSLYLTNPIVKGAVEGGLPYLSKIMQEDIELLEREC